MGLYDAWLNEPSKVAHSPFQNAEAMIGADCRQTGSFARGDTLPSITMNTKES
jgi:hypothetical protein